MQLSIKIFLFLALSITMLSCGDDCEPGTFEQNIVGTWETPAIGESDSGEVTFNANGTGTGTKDGVFYVELNDQGSSDFTWVYNETEELLELNWTFAAGGGLGLDYTVVEFTCDETKLEFFLTFAMDRK